MTALSDPERCERPLPAVVTAPGHAVDADVRRCLVPARWLTGGSRSRWFVSSNRRTRQPGRSASGSCGYNSRPDTRSMIYDFSRPGRGCIAVDELLNFTDQHVFVAGGTSGINLGIAEGFAGAGAKLSVMSRSADKVDAAVATLARHGNAAAGFTADVRDFEAVSRVLAEAHERFGAIHVLVSGAAGNFPAAVLDMSSNAFRAVVDIDLVGTFHMLRAGFEFLQRPGARVINISAPQSCLPAPLQAHVCAAKAGVDMLTRVVALEWADAGVRVNSIIPGPVAGTEGMARLAPSQELLRAVEQSVPVKRLGTVEDIARAALVLASPLGDYINGAVLPVDGGWSLAGFAAVMQRLGSQLAVEGGAR